METSFTAFLQLVGYTLHPTLSLKNPKPENKPVVFCRETHVLRVIRPLKRTHLQSIYTLSGIKECSILSTLELGAAFLLNLETFLTRLAQVTLLEGG